MEILAPPTEAGCVKKWALTKLVFLIEIECLSRGAMLPRMDVFLWWHCVGCCRWMIRKLDQLPNLEELRAGAVSQGAEWLRRALSERSRDELRALAAVGGVETRPDNHKWLTVAELR